MLLNALHQLDNELDFSNASQLCLPSQEKYDLLLKTLKTLFDEAIQSSTKTIGPLKELVVSGVDSESIWEEVQTRNRPLIRYMKQTLSKIKHVLETKQQQERDSSTDDNDSDVDTSESGEEIDGDDISDNDEHDVASNDDDEAFDEFDEEQDDYINDDDDDEEGVDHINNQDNNDEVDFEELLDEVEEMEEKYVNRLQARDGKSGHKGYAEDDDDEDEELDFEIAEKELYNDDGSDEDDNEPGKIAYFKDFFGKPKKSSKKTKAATQKKVSFVSHDEDNDDDVDEEVEVDDQMSEDEGEEDEQQIPEKLTNFQKKQLRIKEEIAQLEKGLIAEKSWDMKGEVKAADRPENSLLEVYVDVERASKPAPIVTQEYTNTLEEMIIKRIADQNFDDVLPKIAEETTDATADLPELSQEKSKAGLGEIYEDEFLSRATSTVKNSAQISAAEEEAKQLYHKVCRELDALSHFHYTPRPVVLEPTITGLPSIAMEEILPLTENGASTSAPEQVQEKRSGRAAAMLSAEELGRDDKKRLRRASKAVRRKQRRMDESEEKLVAKMNPGAGNKYEAKKALEEIRGDRRVVEGKASASKGSGKSSDFFSDLQQQAQIEISSKKAGISKKNKAVLPIDAGMSKKLKL